MRKVRIFLVRLWEKITRAPHPSEFLEMDETEDGFLFYKGGIEISADEYLMELEKDVEFLRKLIKNDEKN